MYEDSPIGENRQSISDMYLIRMMFCYVNSMNALIIEEFTQKNILTAFQPFPNQMTMMGKITCLQLCLATLLLLEEKMKTEKIRESGFFIGVREISRILMENLKIECQKEENEGISKDLMILKKIYSKVDSDSTKIIFGEEVDSDPDEKIIQMVEKFIDR